MKRVALYVRVSTQEQKNHGQSVDSQIVALQEYAKEKGYTVAGIYNDAGISARKRYTKRPALLQLLKDCEEHKIDLVCFTKLDRWFRSVADYYEVQTILEKCKVPWRAIWEDYETETSSGVFKVNIMLSVAQAEADRTSERIKSVNEYRKANGQYVSGKAPTGYKIKNSKLYKDPEKQEAVILAFEEFKKTSSVTLTQRKLADCGVKLARCTVRNLLRNPAYYGCASGHECEPYISKDEWDEIQFILDSRRTRMPSNPKRVYIFSGLIKCGCCGHNYTSKVRYGNGKKNRKPFKRYGCGSASIGLCSNKRTIGETVIERYLVENLLSELNNYNLRVETFDDDSMDYEKETKRIEDRIRRIGDRYELGDIERDEYISKVNALKTELNMMPKPEKKIKKELPCDWSSVYAELDDNHKKEFWNKILKNITINESSIKINF